MFRKIINLIKQVCSCFWKKEKTLKNTKQKPVHRLILVRPRNEWGLVTKPTARILKQQRHGSSFSPPTWAESSPTRREPSIWDQRSSASLAATKPTQRGATRRNLSSFSSSPPLSPPKRASKRARWPAVRIDGPRAGWIWLSFYFQNFNAEFKQS
jgi:hypothetical protein